jgi:hypothetical protein
MTPTPQEMHALAHERFLANPNKCYQRHIRELYAEVEGRVPPCNEECYKRKGKCPHLEGYTVRQISRAEAASVILKYEWLQTLGRGITACYGLFSPEGELMGANALGRMGGGVGDICGPGHENQTVCLMRGVCVPYAPKNAGSFFTSKTCKQAHTDFGWSIFFAYSDASASEFGEIYRICNWVCLGQGPGKPEDNFHTDFESPDESRIVTSYALNRDKGKKLASSLGWDESKGAVRQYLRRSGWKPIRRAAKFKYVWFEGPNRRKLQAKCRYDRCDYPRRPQTPVAPTDL